MVFGLLALLGGLLALLMPETLAAPMPETAKVRQLLRQGQWCYSCVLWRPLCFIRIRMPSCVHVRLLRAVTHRVCHAGLLEDAPTTLYESDPSEIRWAGM